MSKRFWFRPATLVTLALAAGAGCHARVPGTLAVSAPAPAKDAAYVRTPRATSPVSIPVAAHGGNVTVKADVGALLGTARARKLLGLGFADATNIKQMELVAEGAGVPAPVIALAPWTTAPTAPDTTLTLAVPAGANRLFTLNALDANGVAVASIRTVATLTAGGTVDLTFNYATDAAGRTLEDLLFVIGPQQSSNLLVQSLGTTDLSGALVAFITRVTGFNATSNQFTAFNPLYFQDFQLASELASAGSVAPLSYNPPPAQVTQPQSNDVYFAIQDATRQPITSGVTVQVYDPVPGTGVAIAPVNASGQFLVAGVPPGEWPVTIKVNGATMATRLTMPSLGFVPGNSSLAFLQTVTFQATDNGGLPVPLATPMPIPSTLMNSPSPSPAGYVSTLAGSVGGFMDAGVSGASAQFSDPEGLWLDPATSSLYVADAGNQRIRVVSTATGATSTLAGSGAIGQAEGAALSAASFNNPKGVAKFGNVFYVADTGNNAIRRITVDPSSGLATVDTFAGPSGGSGASGYVDSTPSLSRFNKPTGIAVDSHGWVYVADYGNNAIRIIANGKVSTFVGSATGTAGFANGIAGGGLFRGPKTLWIDAGDNLYVGDVGNSAVRKVNPSGRVSTLVANSMPASPSGTEIVAGLSGAGQGEAYDGNNYLYVASYAEGDQTYATGTLLGFPVASPTAAASPIIGLGAGLRDGNAFQAQARGPGPMAIMGNFLYFSDSGNNRIRVAKVH